MTIKTAVLLLFPAAFLMPAGLFAAPVVCGVATLATYESYGSTGCSLGPEFVFSNFNYVLSVSVNENAITAANITVTPQLSGTGPKFAFSANWGTSNSGLPSSYTGIIGFHGASLDPTFNAFNSLTLATTGSTSGVLSVSNVNEVDCVGGLLNDAGTACLSGGVGVTVGASISGAAISAKTVVSFAPATSIDVLKTISLTSTGTALSPAFANLSSVSQEFGTNAPEPSSWLLSFCGVGLAAIRLKQKRA